STGEQHCCWIGGGPEHGVDADGAPQAAQDLLPERRAVEPGVAQTHDLVNRLLNRRRRGHAIHPTWAEGARNTRNLVWTAWPRPRMLVVIRAGVEIPRTGSGDTMNQSIPSLVSSPVTEPRPAAQSAISVRPMRVEDVAACGQIGFEAHGTVAAAHN